jgi:hypothetical protein
MEIGAAGVLIASGMNLFKTLFFGILKIIIWRNLRRSFRLAGMSLKAYLIGWGE